jgi:hypothetical protein
MIESDNLNSENNKAEVDFVAIDIKRNRVCLRGRRDDFEAVKVDGEWKIDYPEFDDLMDKYSELKDSIEIEKYSLEARNFLKRSI